MLSYVLTMFSTVFLHMFRYMKEVGMPTLTVKKLIKFGEGGLVITIPRSWVRYYSLKAGDRLEVIADGELTIRPAKKKKRV